jgi:hypothetical protein
MLTGTLPVCETGATQQGMLCTQFVNEKNPGPWGTTINVSKLKTTPLSCPPGKYMHNGLCYDKCKTGFTNTVDVNNNNSVSHNICTGLYNIEYPANDPPKCIQGYSYDNETQNCNLNNKAEIINNGLPTCPPNYVLKGTVCYNSISDREVPSQCPQGSKLINGSCQSYQCPSNYNNVEDYCIGPYGKQYNVNSKNSIPNPDYDDSAKKNARSLADAANAAHLASIYENARIADIKFTTCDPNYNFNSNNKSCELIRKQIEF